VSDLIYEVQITKENVKELIYKEICRVAMDYHRSPQEIISAMILPASAYKIMEKFAMAECRRLEWGSRQEILSFEGIPLFCGPTTFIMPVYSSRFWHCAHQDAKRMVSEIGGLDS
jgi:hypothetical protein